MRCLSTVAGTCLASKFSCPVPGSFDASVGCLSLLLAFPPLYVVGGMCSLVPMIAKSTPVCFCVRACVSICFSCCLSVSLSVC